MKDFCVVGSGIAGSTIANLLAKKYSVEVFDKARGAGGRAANRRYKKKLSFDHGVQYISSNNKDFIKTLKKNKIIKEWTGTHLDFTFKKNKKNLKYICKRGNNDISKYFLKNIKTNFTSCVKNIKFQKKIWQITLENQKKVYFKNLILAIPYPQLKKLAKKYLNKQLLNLNINMEPNLTFMLEYKNSKNISISSIKFQNSVIAWAANENSKNRFKSKNQLWTLQATEEWSKKNINKYKHNKKLKIKIVLDQFEKLLKFKKKDNVFNNIHGWKYSYNKNPLKFKSYWSKKSMLGVCGDWFSGPKAEDAFISARNLFEKIR